MPRRLGDDWTNRNVIILDGGEWPGWENATLPFLPSCAKLLYFVDFCVTGSVVLLLCVAAGHGRKLNQGWTLLDWLLEFIQKSGLEWELCLTSEGTLFSLRGRHSPSPVNFQGKAKPHWPRASNGESLCDRHNGTLETILTLVLNPS